MKQHNGTAPLNADTGLLNTHANGLSVSFADDGAGCTSIVAVGEIDANTLPRLTPALHRQPNSGTNAVIVDLSRIDFCSCAGVAELLSLLERTNEVAVPLELIVGTQSVVRAIECLGLSEIFSMHVDRRSALDAVGAVGVH